MAKKPPKAKAKKGKQKPKYIGFYFYKSPKLYEKAVKNVTRAGMTLTDYLSDCVENAAAGLPAEEKRISEKALAEKSKQTRHVIREARLDGKFKGLFSQTGRRINYKEAPALRIARGL